ncbi:hypothetical protein B0H15DRAFT_956662 [Mycena belliarum]|uniref:Uncharacterized protein n=1 Tax=Mycena belliarum TaxID=1033014 RepID=A0AAD6XJ60_9AGAR|nr:hypothetical protein B0H15DRAFT_956662 [Mycena belliae]
MYVASPSTARCPASRSAPRVRLASRRRVAADRAPPRYSPLKRQDPIGTLLPTRPDLFHTTLSPHSRSIHAGIIPSRLPAHVLTDKSPLVAQDFIEITERSPDPFANPRLACPAHWQRAGRHSQVRQGPSAEAICMNDKSRYGLSLEPAHRAYGNPSAFAPFSRIFLELNAAHARQQPLNTTGASCQQDVPTPGRRDTPRLLTARM